MKIKIGYKWLIMMGTVFWASVQAMAFNPNTNENLIFFDADGQVIATYHLHDFTSVLDVSGSNYKVGSEAYGGSPLLTPDFHTTLVSSPGSAYAVPNILGESRPGPPAILPQASLFSFDDAVYASTSPTKPGISFSPSPGTYTQTISVSITASPADATVSYSRNGGVTFVDTVSNNIEIYLYKSTHLVVKARHAVMGESASKKAVFAIARDKGIEPEMVDSDHDGLPDSWEVLNSMTYGFNPLESDRDKDTDGDGISDFNELLRGFEPDNPCHPKICYADIEAALALVDPSTEEYHALVSTVGSFHAGMDSDGDGWSDWDENQLRDTKANDPEDTPVARRLNEVERRLSGRFYDIHSTPVPELNYRITSLGSRPLARGISDSGGTYGQNRIPVGEPAIVRGAGLPMPKNPGDPGDPLKNFIVKRYLPVTKDLLPEDVPGTWISAKDWQQQYIEFLRANLVETVKDFDVRPGDYYPLALLERELEILGGVEDVKESSPYLLIGSSTHIPALTTLIDMETLLTAKNQTMNDHLQEIAALLSLVETACAVPPMDLTFFSDADGIYTDWSDTDKKPLEHTMAKLFQTPQGRYLAGLMLEFTLSQLDPMPHATCDVLNYKGDVDEDGLANASEVPTPEQPTGNSSLFSADTDADGIGDLSDNCPDTANTGQKDWDEDGIGDTCDPDRDNDGLDNGIESAFGSNPYDKDSDNDGTSDDKEWLAYSPPGLTVLLTMTASPTKMSFQTIGGRIPKGVTHMEVTLNGIVQKPVVFSSTATTWTCPVTNISSGNNDVVVYARNSGAESSGYAFATLLRVAPETLYVPKEYGTIQAAINASDNGDTVQVSPGTYYENINFKGKHIRVIKAPGKARAVIDGQGIGSVVTFNTGETPFSVLNGFMLTNGSAESGAGIYCGENTGPIITNNTITGNTASSTGGGIYVGKASTPAIIHNTLNANAAVQGGGVYCDITSAPHIENNIITNSSDNAYEIWVTSGAVPAHDYNTIWNTTAQYISGAPLGDHSISENPQFILNDYRLVETSPCIDMGNTMTLYLPDTDQDGQPRNSDGDGDGTPGVDMGAYEHTPGDLCQGNLEGSDSDVDGLEIAIFTRDFGRTDCSPTLPCAADLNQDGQVDEVDLGLFVKDFGQVSCP